MNKLLTICITIIFLGMFISTSTGINLEKNPNVSIIKENTLYVGGKGPNNYTKIQDAIDNANNGNIIFVYDDSSPYFEDITISKSIILNGENKETTVIRFLFDQFSDISILKNDTTISNFTIKGRPLGGNEAINIYSNNNTIKDNKFDDVYTGIDISDSNGNIIKNNIFLNDGIGISINGECNDIKINNNTFYGNGINFAYIDDYPTITMSGNTINNKPLVFLRNVSDKVIDEDAGQIIIIGCNNITIQYQELESVCTGICVLFSENIFIENNSILSCIIGIDIRWTINNSNIRVINNYIRYKWYGCYIKNSKGCIISNNDISLQININLFKYFGSGIYFDMSKFCNINNNILNFNPFGISLIQGSNNNIIENNTIKLNFFGIILDDSINNNIIENKLLKNFLRNIILLDSYNNSLKYNKFKKGILPVSRNIMFRFEIGNEFENQWFGNYWNRPRLLPKLIFGHSWYTEANLEFKMGFQFDWNPANNI